MILIVEGPDGGGKTTLLNYLTKKTNIEIIHGGGPPKSLYEIHGRVSQILDCNNGLFDRTTIISEQVYGPAVRKARMIEEELWNQWTVALGKKGAVLIYCRPPDTVLKEFVNQLEVKDHKSPHHIRKVQENFQEILKLYDKIIRRVDGLGVKIIRFDRTTTKLGDFYKYLVEQGILPKDKQKDGENRTHQIVPKATKSPAPGVDLAFGEAAIATFEASSGEGEAELVDLKKEPTKCAD